MEKNNSKILDTHITKKKNESRADIIPFIQMNSLNHKRNADYKISRS